MNILVNTGATLEFVFEGGAATGAVAVAVRDAAGHAVSAGVATHDPVNAARYTYVLPPQAKVASLTIDWTGTWAGVVQTFESTAEIVGAHLFTIAALRGFDDLKVADANQYPDALIIEHRDAITELFQKVAGFSFIPRYHRDVLAGEGDETLWVTKRRTSALIAATIDNVALTQAELDAIQVLDGRLVRSNSWWPRPSDGRDKRNVVVEYQHGCAAPPARISYVAKVLARYELITADIGDRALSMSTDLGTVRLSVPSDKYPTGIPVVDAELGRYATKGILF